MTTETGDLPPGPEPAPLPPRCGVTTELTDEEIAGIVRRTVTDSLGWGRPFSYLQVTAACLLSPGHPGRHASRQACTQQRHRLNPEDESPVGLVAHCLPAAPEADGTLAAPRRPRQRISYRRKTSHQTSGTNAEVDSDSRIAHNRSVRSHRSSA